MDPRVCKVIGMLQAEAPNVQDGLAAATDNATEPVEKLSTEELALSVCLSESRLRALFKMDTGLTPTQYLKKIKMEKAREMAETTRLKIGEIMTLLGFDDPSHFKRDFKSEHGLSLIECRRRRQEEDK